MTRSVVATWVVAGLELIVLVAVHGQRLGSVWELQFGVLWLLPTVLVLGTTAGLVGGAGLAVVEHAPARAARMTLGTLGGLYGGLVAWGVGGGRHLATLTARGGLTVLVAVVGAAAGALAAPYVARAVRERPARLALLTAAALVVVELVNRFVLVRLYPAFHLGLAILVLLAAPAVALGLRDRESEAPRGRRRWVGPTAVGALAVVALLLARPAATRLAYFDNFRLLLLDQAPVLGQCIRAAAALAPPAPPPAAPECDPLQDPGCGSGVVAAPARAVDLRGRDVLLVTIDAVRADHVGAYGYERATTPWLDALAKTSAVFEHAYCPTPHTSYSVTSMMTGKYLRPLLLQGAGENSQTWADLLRTYGYRTAGFYPPAVFFIDPSRFTAFSERFLGFEYRKVEFLEGEGRVSQVVSYLDDQPAERRLFVWVHLFGPHEPYEAHVEHPFGPRDVDRYDAEIAAADATAGRIVEEFRKRRPASVVILSSDHGEEFGEHGGRYHGTTVYEEQVRVPLVVSAPGAIAARRIAQPVQTVDLLPTVLAALDIPIPPRVRGRDLGPLLAGAEGDARGMALAETEEHAMLAQGPLRLVCARRIGACRLFDVIQDPAQTQDVSAARSTELEAMRKQLRWLGASHGRYEVRGLRAEGRNWPAALLRGVSGDGDVAADVAALLDDADLAIRRKAAQVLFELRRPETAASLRLALRRAEDEEVKRWCALALTRLGQGAPLAFELVRSGDERWRRLAALALAESGDARGEAELVAWWKEAPARDYVRSRQMLDAFAKVRSKDAVWPLAQSLDDVRLRPYIAAALARIGESVARVPLARAFSEERYQGARVSIARALVDLGAEAEIAPAMIRFLGVPDPLQGGLGLAAEAGILEHLGGPGPRKLAQVQKHGDLGVALDLVVPRGGNGTGVRVLVRARATGQSAGQVIVGSRLQALRYDREGRPILRREIPVVDPERQVRLSIPAGEEAVEVHATAPSTMDLRPGRAAQVVVVVDRQVELLGLAVVPLADELPPPAPEPWEPGPAETAPPPPSGSPPAQ